MRILSGSSVWSIWSTIHRDRLREIPIGQRHSPRVGGIDRVRPAVEIFLDKPHLTALSGAFRAESEIQLCRTGEASGEVQESAFRARRTESAIADRRNGNRQRDFERGSSPAEPGWFIKDTQLETLGSNASGLVSFVRNHNDQ
jgi:hypothetical protein